MLGLTLSTCLLLAASLGLADASTTAYLYPAPPAGLSARTSRLLLSRHLGLERFESVRAEDEQWLMDSVGAADDFVGKGGDALLVSLAEEDAKESIPASLQPAVTTSDSFWRQPASLIDRYLAQASHIYSSLYSSHSSSSSSSLGVPRLLDTWTLTAPTKATETFIQEISALVDFLETETDDADRKFGAFDLQGLSEIKREYGAASEQYTSAKETLHAILLSALAKPNLNLALLTHPASPAAHNQRRQPPPSQTPMPLPIPNEPLGSFARCFQSEDACVNGTSSCSAHGACVQASQAAARGACWVCACAATRSERGKTEVWAGDACERKDVSGPFVLLTGTVVVLVLLIAGSVGLLFAIDGDKLPSTLSSAVAPGLKKE